MKQNLKKILIQVSEKILGKKNNFEKINYVESLDSIQMMEFISFLEKKLKITIRPEKINRKNFTSFKNILKLINEISK